MSALLSLAAPLLAGLAIVRALLGPSVGPTSERVLRGATGVAFGAGLASLSHAALLFFGGGPAAALSVAKDAAFAGVAAASTLILLRGRRTQAAPLAAPASAMERVPTAWIAAVAIACLATLVVFVRRTIHLPDGEFDAVAFWNLRGRLLLRGGGDPDVVFSPLMAASHPDYPLLLPGLSAVGWLHAGDTAPWVPAAQALLWLALLVVVLGAALARLSDVRRATLGILALLAAPLLVTISSQQYADVPLATLLLLALVWLAMAHRAPTKTAGRCLALCGACASLAAWTKNEGLAQCLAIAIVVAALPPSGVSRARALRSLFAGALPFLVVAIGFKWTLPPANDLVARSSQAGLVARLLDPSRYAAIARAFLEEPFRVSHWSLVLPVLLAVPVLDRSRATTPDRRPVGAALGLIVLAYAGVYVLTPQPLSWHLDSSIHRLLLHVYPALVVWTLAGTAGVQACTGAADRGRSTRDERPAGVRGPESCQPERGG